MAESPEVKQARFEEVLKHTREEYGHMRDAFNTLNKTVQSLREDVLLAQDNKANIESLFDRMNKVEIQNEGFKTTFRLLYGALTIAIGVMVWVLTTQYSQQMAITSIQDSVNRFNRYPEDIRK